MGYPAVTNTFVESATAYASAVNANFSDVINGISDGTKDINVKNATVQDTLTLQSTISTKNVTPVADDTYDLGSSALQYKDAYVDGILNADAINMADNDKIQLRDSAISINSEDDGHLDLTADTSIDLNAASVVVSGTVSPNQIELATDKYIQFRNANCKVYSYGDASLALDSTNVRITSGVVIGVQSMSISHYFSVASAAITNLRVAATALCSAGVQVVGNLQCFSTMTVGPYPTGETIQLYPADGSISMDGDLSCDGASFTSDVSMTGKLNVLSTATVKHVQPVSASAYYIGNNLNNWARGYFDDMFVTQLAVSGTTWTQGASAASATSTATDAADKLNALLVVLRAAKLIDS